ncbi:MAG: DnaJ domain-containing protein [Proteobacteria bacterium]|nr:DnaJ domain-containing protein [Pseudomonadota bacterium]
MATQRPEPIARGNFAKTPFAHILVYLMNRRLTGTLAIEEGADAIDIYFRDGMPAKARTSKSGHELGQVLRDMGVINQEQLLTVQRQMATRGGLQGQLFIENGFLHAQDLVAAITRQMIRKICDAFAMPNGHYAFYDKTNLLVAFGPAETIPLDTLALLAEGVSAHAATLDLDPVLHTLKDRLLYLDDPGILRRFQLTKEMRILSRHLLEKPVRYDHLCADSRFDPQRLRAMLYVFAITRVLQTADLEKEDSGEIHLSSQRFESIAPPPATPAEYAPEVAALRDEIQTKAAQIPTQNYYEMLGISHSATAEDARKAFFKAARIYHPDKAAKPELIDLRDTLAFVFTNLSEAHSTIIDPDAREEYDRAIATGEQRRSTVPGAPTDDPTGAPKNEEQEVRDALEAETSFQKGLVLMRREQYEKAWDFIETAYRLRPQEPEYISAIAHLRIVFRKEPVAKHLPEMRDAAQAAPRSERVRLFLALALKRDNKMNEARDHFEAVVDINPHNIEAARELRLMKMRRNTDPPKGILSRLFTKN